MEMEDQQGNVLRRRGAILLITKKGESHLLVTTNAILSLRPGFAEAPIDIHPMECAVVIIDNKRDCVEIRAITDADAIRHAASHVSWTEMDRDPNYGPPPEFDETDYEQQVEDLAIAIG